MFGVHLMTILPIQTSFSIAEYVGYRVIENHIDGNKLKHNAEGATVWEKGRAFFDALFGASDGATHAPASENGFSEKHVSWEILWKKSVRTGNLCRITLIATATAFSNFELLIKEWATVPSAADVATSSASPPTPSVALEPAAEGNPANDKAERSAGAAVAGSLGQIEEEQSRTPPRNSFQRNLSTKVVSESSLLLPEHIDFLVSAMPDRFNQHKWDLVYSTGRDGISLQTLYRRVAKTSPTILVVQDMRKHVFGVFAPDPWRVHHKFYGTGETFVFKLEPKAQSKVYHWNQKEHSKDDRNNFFMFSTDDCIGVGGGGHFALWLDEDLLYGNSTKSKTFNNTCLSSSEVFQVLNIEVWRLWL